MSQPDPFGQADDFFAGGNPSISFKGDHNLGRPKGGTIVSIGDKQQATDFSDRTPKVWKSDGSPIMVLPVRLQTDERDPQDPHDDGIRTLWIEEGSALKKAVADALRATRGKLRPGAVLLVAWVSGKGETGDPKQYQCQFTPAVPGAAGADSMFAHPTQAAPQQPAAPAWPTQPQQPAAAPAWGQAPAQPAAPAWGPPAPATPVAAQWPTQPAAPAVQPPAPLAAVPPQPAAPTFDLHAIAAAYQHLTEAQRAAIVASMQAGMTADQVISVFGPPQVAA